MLAIHIHSPSGEKRDDDDDDAGQDKCRTKRGFEKSWGKWDLWARSRLLSQVRSINNVD